MYLHPLQIPCADDILEYSQESPQECIFIHYKFHDGMKHTDHTAVIHTIHSFWYKSPNFSHIISLGTVLNSVMYQYGTNRRTRKLFVKTLHSYAMCVMQNDSTESPEQEARQFTHHKIQQRQISIQSLNVATSTDAIFHPPDLFIPHNNK